jgi:hypothetical protein
MATALPAPNLNADTRPCTIVIAMQHNLRQALCVRSYEIDGLLPSEDEPPAPAANADAQGSGGLFIPGPPSLSPRQLVERDLANLLGESDSDESGRAISAGPASIVVFSGRLIVTATPAVQSRVRYFLDGLPFGWGPVGKRAGSRP